MNNLKGILKQKTLGDGVQAKPAPGMSSFMNQPNPGGAPSGVNLSGGSLGRGTGLLKKKAPAVKAMPNLMNRLTGK